MTKKLQYNSINQNDEREEEREGQIMDEENQKGYIFSSCQSLSALSFSTSIFLFLFGLITGYLLNSLTHTLSPSVPIPSYFPSQSHSLGEDVVSFMHISDTHIDYFFNPNQSLPKGVCHPCEFYHSCPSMPTNTTESDTKLRRQGYAFGRYGCNPPHHLFTSLLNQMTQIDPNPPVIVFTGDISPHAYPDDNFPLTKHTELDDLCELKFQVTEQMIQELVRTFPNTRWAYALGNNDHFPKDLYWQPYITRYGKMLYDNGFFTQQQYHQFISHGCSFVDVDGIRYLSVDMMVFAPYGIAFSNYTATTTDTAMNQNPPRHHLIGSEQRAVLKRLLSWLESSLSEAADLSLPVYLIGHQPLTTKEGHNEMDVHSEYYSRFKTLLASYSSIIKVGLFGHHNYAFVEEIMSSSFLPLIPSVIAPGVSPRGKNNPAFHVVYRSKSNGTVLDIKQMKFDLLEGNRMAQITNDPNYLGKWEYHSDILHSWQTLSGSKEFTAESLAQFLKKVPETPELFFAMQVWRGSGYVGEDTPEAYRCRSKFDQEEPLMKCLFPEQNLTCWYPREWL